MSNLEIDMSIPNLSDRDRLANEADRAAEQLGLSGRHNGDWDAFRHAYVSAEITRQYGEGWAHLLGNIVELRRPEGFFNGEANMDLWNNARGREIGKDSAGKEDTIERIKDALLRGDLMRDPRDPRDRYFDDYDLRYPLDHARIAGIRQRTQTASTIPSPIILDLDGDGVIRTVGMSSGVYFDHAADGFAERSGWVAPGDGLLVWDRNANGVIDSGREFFGSETLLPNGLKAVNGFAALRALDANGDGVIDANDPVFTQLRVWVDASTDARTGQGELLTLEDAGVRSINVNYTHSNYVDAHGNQHRQVGRYTTPDGQTRAATDVWFTVNMTSSLPTDWVEIPADIALLPDAQGYGKVRDLHQAMAIDTTGKLKALVATFTQATTPEDRDALVTQIIYRWTGVHDINPASRTNSGWGNAIGDARKLEALEEFLGEEWRQLTWGANPGRDAARTLNEAYDQLEALVYGQLMSQGHQSELFRHRAGARRRRLDRRRDDIGGASVNGSRRGIDRVVGFSALAQWHRSVMRMDIDSFRAEMQTFGTDVAQAMDAALVDWVAAFGPTEGDDVLRGTELNEWMDGRGGNGRLLGRGGNDTLIGGADNDILDGEAGDTQVLCWSLKNRYWRGGVASNEGWRVAA
jgi:hypothetical protein